MVYLLAVPGEIEEWIPITVPIWGVSRNFGVPLSGPKNKDDGILGSVLGSLYLGKTTIYSARHNGVPPIFPIPSFPTSYNQIQGPKRR